MNRPIDLDEKRVNRPVPFKVRSLDELEGKTIPERDWLVPSILVRRSITLFSGDGGTGKSLMVQQLQVAAALGVDWLGLPIKEPISSFGFYCEDDDDELDRRFSSICKHYGVSFCDVADRVRYISRVGEPNELVTFQGKFENQRPVRTALFSQVEDEVEAWGTQLVCIDTAADTFAGNENIRPQVRAFVNMIRRFALINNGGVIITSHPSKSAMMDGSGFSGSTAWNGSVRNRLYLTRPKMKSEDEEEAGPTDDRVLKIMKSNYGPFGERLRIRWEHGVFARTDGVTGTSMVEKLDARRIVLEIATEIVNLGGMLSALPDAPTSLLKKAKLDKRCKDLSWGLLKTTQEILLREGRLQLVELGPKSKRRKYVRPSGVRYPGEIGSGEDLFDSEEEAVK